jgi:hypothetical protein
MAADRPRYAWLLNLDADRELRCPSRYKPQRLPGNARAWTRHMADLVSDDDWLLDDMPADVSPSACQVMAFCPTPSALARISALGFAPPPAPALSILQQVNDRAFCAELGQTLPDACFARDMATLEGQLARPSFTGSYVIKRAFSFAGREQRRVHDGAMDESTRGFCLRSLRDGEGLQIEPWVQRLGDFSLHGYLSETGMLSIGPAREPRCDDHGRFLEVTTEPAHLTEDELAQLTDELQLTAAALTRAGYFGPFGIDAFRYRGAGGSVAFNPRCEINARFTMAYPRTLLFPAVTR